jgi:hypothetical protein
VRDVSSSYRKHKKVGHRPWFAPEEYTALYKATGAYKNRNGLHDWERWNAEQLHDLALFLSNTGPRPDEANNLEHCDIAMVRDGSTRKLILEIAVRGKTGFGPCKHAPLTPVRVSTYSRKFPVLVFNAEYAIERWIVNLGGKVPRA